MKSCDQTNLLLKLLNWYLVYISRYTHIGVSRLCSIVAALHVTKLPNQSTYRHFPKVSISVTDFFCYTMYKNKGVDAMCYAELINWKKLVDNKVCARYQKTSILSYSSVRSVPIYQASLYVSDMRHISLNVQMSRIMLSWGRVMFVFSYYFLLGVPWGLSYILVSVFGQWV